MRIRHKPWAVPELLACGYYIEQPEAHKNNWRALFSNNNPVYLEVGCGKGSFIAQLAAQNPEINYIAIDIKSEMLGLAKRNIEKQFDGKKPNNVLLASYDVERLSDVFGAADAIDRLYINFCNPWPKAKHNKHRLTHTKQLFTYKSFLSHEAEIRFKTDDDGLFLSSKRYFPEAGFKMHDITYDLHAENRPDNIVTEHEKMFSEQGIKIKALTATAAAKKLVLFDLDGTLVNSLKDLAFAVNHALTKNGYPEQPEEKFYHFVGDGVFKLIERALPTEYAEDATVHATVKADFDAYYHTHYAVYTKPYDGVNELLQTLKANGCKLAVVSNKPHEFSCEIVEKYFPSMFDLVLGHSSRFEKKPDPSVVDFILREFEVEKTDAVLIGDSNVDIHTGQNAGIMTIGVSWGFRGREELQHAGADVIVDVPAEVLRYAL